MFHHRWLSRRPRPLRLNKALQGPLVVVSPVFAYSGSQLHAQLWRKLSSTKAYPGYPYIHPPQVYPDWLSKPDRGPIHPPQKLYGDPIPSAERSLVDSLKALKHDKWGFVIYRCTYKDDHAWDRFKRILRNRTLEDIAESDTPEAAESLEWTFVEDRAEFDVVSRGQLRERFQEWAAHAIASEQPRAHIRQCAVDQMKHCQFCRSGRCEISIFGIPRYNYFIQVDEEALQSVLSSPEDDVWGHGFVNFVDSRWRPLTYTAEEEASRHECEDEPYDPIDGCIDENVGCMKVDLYAFGAEWYNTSSDFAGGTWYTFYKRPPEIVMC